MAGGPSIPDPSKAAVQGVVSDAENFPFQYIINQLAQMGGAANVGGKNYDFTGLGTADNAAVMSDQMAQALLDIQKNYGADFVKQRIEDLKRSDPQGYAARKQLFDRITAEADSGAPNAKMSSDLQDLVNKQLTDSGRLTSGPGGELEEVQQGVRGQQIANGITLGNAPASAEASAVEQASENKRTQTQQAAANYLNAGISPEDIQYRKIQQDLANLGAFRTGETPTAQFASLSGAQNGAAPFTTNYDNPIAINPNAAAQGLNNANRIYASQANYFQTQANPYLAGLSMLTSTANLAGGLGWRPFASNPGAITMPAPAGGGGGYYDYTPTTTEAYA